MGVLNCRCDKQMTFLQHKEIVFTRTLSNDKKRLNRIISTYTSNTLSKIGLTKHSHSNNHQRSYGLYGNRNKKRHNFKSYDNRNYKQNQKDHSQNSHDSHGYNCCSARSNKAEKSKELKSMHNQHTQSFTINDISSTVATVDKGCRGIRKSSKYSNFKITNLRNNPPVLAPQIVKLAQVRLQSGCEPITLFVESTHSLFYSSGGSESQYEFQALIHNNVLKIRDNGVGFGCFLMRNKIVLMEAKAIFKVLLFNKRFYEAKVNSEGKFSIKRLGKKSQDEQLLESVFTVSQDSEKGTISICEYNELPFWMYLNAFEQIQNHDILMLSRQQYRVESISYSLEKLRSDVEVQ